MFRQTIVVLLGAALLAPAAFARYNPPPSVPAATAARVATTCHQYCGTRSLEARPPAGPAVVRTKLVASSSDGFDWLDAAVGFGFAVVISAGVALLIRVAASHRTGVRPARSAS